MSGSEARYRAVFEQAGIGVGRTLPDGPRLETNDRYCLILHLGREERLARSREEITRADHLVGDVAGVARPVRSKVGNPNVLIAVAEDIGARKAAEAEPERLNRDV